MVDNIYNYFLEQNQTDILKGVSAYNNSLSKHDLDTELINFGQTKFENVTKENLPRQIFSSKFYKGIKLKIPFKILVYLTYFWITGLAE